MALVVLVVLVMLGCFVLICCCQLGCVVLDFFFFFCWLCWLCRLCCCGVLWLGRLVCEMIGMLMVLTVLATKTHSFLSVGCKKLA